MAVIVWLLDLQLPMQSVPMTTNFVSLNHAHGKVYFTTLCDKVCQRLATGRWFSPQGSYRCLKSLKVLENESSKIKDLKVLEFQ